MRTPDGVPDSIIVGVTCGQVIAREEHRLSLVAEADRDALGNLALLTRV